MSYRRFNLTLTVVEPEDREKFNALDRSDSYREIRPNTRPGARGAYSVELSEEEYEQALRDAEDPGVNLIAVEPVQYGALDSVPGSTELTYLAAQEAEGALGLKGNGVIVAVIDSGLSGTVRDEVFAGRIAASTTLVGGDPFDDDEGHGTWMASLATPSQARLAVGKVYSTEAGGVADEDVSAGLYWAADTANVHVISLSISFDNPSTVLEDAVAHVDSKHILLFSSAGNHGDADLRYPAGYAQAKAISEYNAETDLKEATSSYGPHIWAASAGRPVTWYAVNGDEATVTIGGTSAATALAARLAAAMMTNGNSSGNAAKYLAENARKTGASPQYEGNGVLQLAAAANAMKGTQPPAENPDGSTPLPDGGTIEPAGTAIPPGSSVTPPPPPQTVTYPDGSTVEVPEGSTVDACIPTDGGGSGGTGSDGLCPGGSDIWIFSYETYDPLDSVQVAIRDCLLSSGTWGDFPSGVKSPSGFEGFPAAGGTSGGGEVVGECVDLLLESAEWALDGSVIMPPDSWKM